MSRLRTALSGVLSATAMLVVLAGTAEGASLRVNSQHFEDAAGRTVVLRGVNVAGNSKVPPFMPASAPAIFAPLQEWGMNVVRLLFTWEAYEPAPGEYDEAYLDYHAAAAKAAWEHGLYVIVDFHQDGYSRFSIGGCGDGAPQWALPPSVTPAVPDNGPACANWGVKMLSDQDMQASWAAFHADENGAKTRYLAMLESVSARLAGEPGVIGYDIMNEPWGDEATELGALYEEAAVALRKAHPEAILFVSPHARTSAGTQTELVKPGFDNFAYAPHFYDASVVLFDSWSGVEPDQPFDFMNGKAEEWGVPLFLGEFGAPGPAENGAQYIDVLYERLNEDFSSGAQWVYTPGWTEEAKDGWNDEDFSVVDGEGATRPNFRVRPYPRAIAGTPVAFRLDDSVAPPQREIELEWEHDPAARTTELFVPRLAFFETEDVAVSTTGEEVHCFFEGSLLKCFSGLAGPKKVVVKRATSTESPRCGLVGVELLALWALSMAARASRRMRRSGPEPSRRPR